MIDPTTAAGPTLWTSPQSPGRAPANMDGTAAQISAARHIWEEDVQTYPTCTSMQQALKKQIISMFEPMFLDIVNDNMVVYANISAIGMLDHLIETYGNITAVDLEINFEHMRQAWNPQQPVESLLKQIQDCSDYSEAGGPHWAPATHQHWVCQNICNRSLHERMSSVEQDTCHRKNLDTIQISLCCRSLSAQANAGRIRCHRWLPLCKYRR
jgi:hypothetical protein